MTAAEARRQRDQAVRNAVYRAKGFMVAEELGRGKEMRELLRVAAENAFAEYDLAVERVMEAEAAEQKALLGRNTWGRA
jgi:hypothetical protein